MGEILYACDDSDMQLIGKFLSFASRGDRVGLNQMLIQGVSPDVQDYDNRTALHLAASEGHTPIVELLVCYRANVNLQDRWKRTQEEMVLITEYLPKVHTDVRTVLRCGFPSVRHRTVPARACLHPNGLQQFLLPLSLPGESTEFQFSNQITQNFKQSQSGQKTGIRRTRRGWKVVGETVRVRWGGGAPSPVPYGGEMRDVRTLRAGNLEDILNQRTRLDVHTALRYALDIARLIQKCTSGGPSDGPPFEDIIGILEEEVLSLGRACPLVC
ncbi:hypothetical protein ACLB2K_022376 [Fragaria x ananassa]